MFFSHCDMNNLNDLGTKEKLVREISPDELEAWPVYTIRTPKERPDGKMKHEPFVWEGLPELGNDEAEPLQKSLF